MADHVLMSGHCPKCHDCESFFVTWDNKAPMGCQSFGFKGKQLPSLVVLQSTGQQCCYFRDKRGQGCSRMPEALPENCTLSITA
jgi:hypothetical protein